MITDPQRDPMGQAMLAYYQGELKAAITVLSNIAEDDTLSAAYLFRNVAGMPQWEQDALDACEGSVLDIGAGAGSHALALQARGHKVVGLDISPGAVEVMKLRGLKEVVHGDVWSYTDKRFDTLLLMMNGIGLVGTIERLKAFLRLAPKRLRSGGQILLDSSDIAYLFPHNEKAVELLLHPEYYGIVRYQMQYQTSKGKPFDWLYIDLNYLREIAEAEGYEVDLLTEGHHFQYLARLRPTKK